MRVTEKFLLRFLKSTIPISTDTRIDKTTSITITIATTAMIVVRLLLSSLLFELSADTASVGMVLSVSSLVGVGVITVMLSKLSPGDVKSSVGKDSSVTVTGGTEVG